jgi:hypothetical protein
MMTILFSFLMRVGATLLVFSVSLALFWAGIGLVAYRLPAFKERQVFEAAVGGRKVDGSNRTLFEMLFGRAMVPLDEHTEFYLPKAGNPWIGQNFPPYRVTISASPLMFGGYADAELVMVEPLGPKAPRD